MTEEKRLCQNPKCKQPIPSYRKNKLYKYCSWGCTGQAKRDRKKAREEAKQQSTK